ncbi:MAG: hypothetical protein KC506_00845 [Nanoarchaeota archaeon]|nr:hypothetical protein [Nanoarchaeota archaeon]
MKSKKPQEKLERILLLDNFSLVMPKIEGVSLKIIQQDKVNLGTKDVYKFFNEELDENIRRLTQDGEVDYVVIGNNRGAGVVKASAVAEDMRANRTCIVWNEYFSGAEIFYVGLGINYFISRRDLGVHLEKYLRAKYSE